MRLLIFPSSGLLHSMPSQDRSYLRDGPLASTTWCVCVVCGVCVCVCVCVCVFVCVVCVVCVWCVLCVVCVRAHVQGRYI